MTARAAGTASNLRRLGALAALLVVAWLAVGAVGGARIGELSTVAKNDSAAFLPTSSESARVAAELAATRQSAEALPAIVIAARDAGVTDTDRGFLSRAIANYQQAAAPPGAASTPAEARIAVSDDGAAAQAVVPMDAGDQVRSEVGALRAALADPPPGLTVLVTGPAGQIADLVHAFGGIDGILLLVAGGVVALILLIVYRGPLLVLTVLLSAVFALSAAAWVIYALAEAGTIQLSGMSQGILFILVFGAATDYALLLVSRYRQELRDEPRAAVAMVRAWRAVFAPITASAGTVVLGVLCLLLSDLASNRDLGPIAAIGIGCAYLSSMTFLPAALLLGRRVTFWPLIPHPGTDHPEVAGLWRRISSFVDRNPRRIWAVTALVLLGCVALVPQLKAHGTTQSETFLTSVDSVTGEKLLDEHFPGGTGSPTVVLFNADEETRVGDALGDPTVMPDLAATETSRLPPTPGEPARMRMDVTLRAAPGSPAALSAVQRIRDAVHAVDGADAMVGGQDALQLDTNRTSERDRDVIIPVVLLVVFAVLALLLRAIIAPLLLIGTVVLSYFATLGVAALMFNHVFGFPGADPAVPLFAFVFLVALGIDYNIFLMTRVREETVTHGTRTGTVRGLAFTGGVITSAGVVLAATFAALAVLPILFLAQLAFLVAFGVLLDTIVVRSLLVPAATIDIGRRVWWPSRLAAEAGLGASVPRNRRGRRAPD